MDCVLLGLPFLFVHHDNILVPCQVLSRLGENRLTIDLNKSVFAQSEVKVLGHRVLASSIPPMPGHMKAVEGSLAPHCGLTCSGSLASSTSMVTL